MEKEIAMSHSEENIYTALERIFHEPSRLAIMSALVSEAHGMAFVDLKERCDLTDGNLSRHLKVLEEAGSVKIKKEFVKSRPRTTLFCTHKGRTSFIQYLKALEEVLKKAEASIRVKEKSAGVSLAWAKTEAS
jgi:DNA-binding transcriptional ArsR family regulator